MTKQLGNDKAGIVRLKKSSFEGMQLRDAEELYADLRAATTLLEGAVGLAHVGPERKEIERHAAGVRDLEARLASLLGIPGSR